ncbi:hypothetical protein [Stenotrophomonas phage BUCTxx99]|nr:hypothetical protein [Stenotrophomonas phage BUCTxx99]
MDDVHPKTINDLLAIIHRDGGQYLDANGMEEALRRAAEIVVNERAKLELQERMNSQAFRSGMVTGRNVAHMERLGKEPVRDEVDVLIARINRYSNALSLIRNGDPMPERIADEALYGEARAALGIVRG